MKAPPRARGWRAQSVLDVLWASVGAVQKWPTENEQLLEAGESVDFEVRTRDSLAKPGSGGRFIVTVKKVGP